MSLPLAERDVTRQVKDFLGYRGWRAVRMQRTIVPGAFQTGEDGIADYEFIHYLEDPRDPKHEQQNAGWALVLWIEFKRRGKKATDEQIAWRFREERRGALVRLVDDFEEFERWYSERFGWLHRDNASKNGAGEGVKP